VLSKHQVLANKYYSKGAVTHDFITWCSIIESYLKLLLVRSLLDLTSYLTTLSNHIFDPKQEQKHASCKGQTEECQT